MTLAGIRLFLRGDQVTKLKYDDVVGDLDIFNVNGSFECMPIDMFSKEEMEAPTALAAWYERAIPFMDLTRHLLLLLSFITGVRTECMFANVEDLEESTKTYSIINNEDHIKYKTFFTIFHALRATNHGP